jgi:hypothetical protein
MYNQPSTDFSLHGTDLVRENSQPVVSEKRSTLLLCNKMEQTIEQITAERDQVLSFAPTPI